MKFTEDHVPNTDRYAFDFNHCTYRKGWFQLDTGQDASYYGTWVHPEKKQILCYLEGDVHVTTCDDEQEFVAEIQDIKDWNEKAGHGFIGIDPGLSPGGEDRLKSAGLGEFIS